MWCGRAAERGVACRKPVETRSFLLSFGLIVLVRVQGGYVDGR